MPSRWPDFYRRNAERYAHVAEHGLQSAAVDSSHPLLTGDWDLVMRLAELAPGAVGLDAGCGPGARDMRRLLHLGFDMMGIDGVEEGVRLTHELRPDLSRRVFTADMREPLPFEDEEFDFALCVSVLQHINPDVAHQATLPELARVLRPGGVLLLAFKQGSGTASVYDHHYQEERHFLLYDEREVLQTLEACGMRLILAESSDELGGLLYCSDVKGLRYCAIFARKHVAGRVPACEHARLAPTAVPASDRRPPRARRGAGPRSATTPKATPGMPYSAIFRVTSAATCSNAGSAWTTDAGRARRSAKRP